MAAAKTKAVNEFLNYFLEYSEEELDFISIEDIIVSAKADNIVYIAFGDLNDIKEIYSRISECKNPAINVRNYIPPQFFDRFMFISKRCAEIRAENPEIKTQMRFTSFDIEVLTKMRGSEEPFRTVSLDSIADPLDIPNFDPQEKMDSQE